MSSMIKVKKLKKIFDDKVAVDNISFSIEKNTFTVLLGPSGCGKTTILRMIAGLENPTDGDILIDGKSVISLEPSKREISMVFQSYALFPHMSVEENIVFGLKIRKTNDKQIEEKLHYVANLLGLNTLLDKKPSQLSGGQKQRVALARSFVSEHKICLMDEPLSNLDAKLRQEMRIEIKELQKRLKLSVLYVTHDQVEAMSMADKIILLNNGKIEQEGKPKDLYENVTSTFVGRFIGIPPMNIIKFENKEDIEGLLKKVGIVISNDYLDRVTYVGIRPEDLFLDSKSSLKGTVLFSDYHGCDTILGIDLQMLSHKDPFLIKVKTVDNIKVGSEVGVSWETKKIKLFDKNTKIIM